MSPRGNPRQETFFGEKDYQHYLELMARFCRAEQVAIRAYCLMPNHVYLIVVPQSVESLRSAIGEAHRRYTRWINFREGWRGHLWQGRFASFVMDEDHLLTAARYVELNPVRAGLVPAPGQELFGAVEQNLGRILRRQNKRVTTENTEEHGKGKLIRILFSVYFGGFRG